MTDRSHVLEAVARIYERGPWASRTLQQLRPYICPFELLVDLVPQGSRVLDVGCGSGLFLSLLAERGLLSHGVGFDVRDSSVAFANFIRESLPDPAILTFVRDDGSFTWPVREFDVVSMVDVMHHVAPAEQHEIIRKVAKALRPGGVFLYKDMVQTPLWRAWANRLHDLVMAGQWIHYLALADVVRLARESGLTLEECVTVNRLWYGHELAVFSLADGRHPC